MKNAGESSRVGRSLRLEFLENRFCLSASVGWDGTGLGGAELTYYVGEVPSELGIDQADVENALETALEAWAEVADITFTATEAADQPDSIDFEFVSIDGSGGTLAQAYFPDDINPEPVAGDVEFDLAETWEIGNDLGEAAFDFVYVAVHEIGHALGLDHCDAVDSVMAAYTTANQAFEGLSTADVAGIGALYAPVTDDLEPDLPEQPQVPELPDDSDSEPEDEDEDGDPDWYESPEDVEGDADPDDDDGESPWDDTPPDPLDPADDSDPDADADDEEDDTCPGRFHFPNEGNVFGPRFGRPGDFYAPGRFGGPQFAAQYEAPVAPPTSQGVDQVFGHESDRLLAELAQRIPIRSGLPATVKLRGFARRV